MSLNELEYIVSVTLTVTQDYSLRFLFNFLI